MPLDKGGKFHMNPQVGRMHDAKPMAKIAKPGGGMEGGESGGAKGHVELHAGPAPDGKGKFHTIHHPGGEARGHETLHEAHHAVNAHMGEDGCKGEGCAEHGGAASPMAGAEPDGDEGQDY